ncbi:MAG: ROK family protein [Alphaproteobacteria bacterium]|nr:ROK family protein [Alphaproteobacteria bacterium]
MSIAIGLDIGGTKIAGAAFDAQGNEVARTQQPTPADYGAFLETCCAVVAELEGKTGKAESIGACAPYAVANLPFLVGKPLREDLGGLLGHEVGLANDANCAALAEAVDGAGQGHASVFGLILGTGVGGGFVLNGKVVAGAHGLCGEIGHLPLPFYEEDDGERVMCGCSQKGCIDKLASGPALIRLYKKISGQDAHGASMIAERAGQGDRAAAETLDRYYTVVAKAMVAIIHSFDPDVIAVSGGVSKLPGLYEEVPKRWGRYALAKAPKTRFVQAKHGAMAGLRGAALIGKMH